ncbi:MAG: hypothetical protein U9N86_16675 [Bacteroidota bacterium]|nr:hypothetical protein [Bacteroidota bacterium]
MTKQIKHLVLLIILGISQTLSGQISPELFTEMNYRNLGAFRIGSWVSDIAVPENPNPENQYTWYVAQRAGGVWKTVNNGNTFSCISDDLNTNSIGCVEIAPSNPNLIWIGTGEAYSARSSYAGNGVYKSLDGGKTWEDMGLKDSHHVNRIIIHPDNPDIVYVAAMGHLFSDNEERGVFKTINGGKTWDKILYISEKVGIIDLVINRQNPDILFAASYDMSRSAWHFEAGGPESRIFKTSDAGENWAVVNSGLPQGELGRIGIDIHRANPDIIYAVIQNLNPDPDYIANANQTFNEFTDNSYDALIGGQVYKSINGGGSWKNISPEDIDVSGKAAYSFNMIYADPLDPDVAYIIGAGMNYTLNGGKTWPKGWREKTKFRSNFGDNRCFWIDPANSKHIMLGSDGGIYSSWDTGEHMHHYYHIPAGEVYHVEVDDAKPYNIYIGLQDHETWKSPVNNWNGSIGIEDWVITGMWDGMYTQVNHENNRWLYFTTQFGKHHREDQLTGTRWSISPIPPDGAPPYRFTWTTPIIISPHNSATLYAGAQCLLRSPDRGETWEEISPDLTNNDPDKIAGKGHMMHCTITSISESSIKPGIIWVGTDDGHIHMTTNHGASWTELNDVLAIVGAPTETWVSRVAASKHSEGRAYVCKSGYREDIFKPFVYKTEDFGKTWTAITDGLPDAPVSVIFEDQSNEDLLYAGTDVGVYVSFNRGGNWISLQQNMPIVPVRDLLIHPREKDLVVGTYGRGAWIMDVSLFSEISSDLLKKEIHLFDIQNKPQKNYSDRRGWGNQQMKGDNHLRTPNEPNGFEIYYYLKNDSKEEINLIISDYTGKEVVDRKINATKGLHKLFIDTSRLKPDPYQITLKTGDQTIIKTARVLESPTWPVGRI